MTETKTIHEFLAENPDVDVSSAWERAWVFDDLEQKRKAVADFRRFLDLAPEDECPECREEAEQYIRENSQ